MENKQWLTTASSDQINQTVEEILHITHLQLKTTCCEWFEWLFHDSLTAKLAFYTGMNRLAYNNGLILWWKNGLWSDFVHVHIVEVTKMYRNVGYQTEKD